MNEQIDIETVRAEALRKLGRNIVNFSKIEAVLKYLLSVSQFKGTKETISEQFHRNHDKHRKETLGKLVREFHNNVLVNDSQVEATTTHSNSEFSVSFKVTYDDQNFLKSQKRTLSDIVVERNKLIHQDLALLDTSCVEDYRKLISLLDEQNPRLLAHLEELGWMIEAMGDNLKTLKDLLKSPEFLQYIQSNKSEVATQEETEKKKIKKR
ncbi:MAG TPA: hypothetical protein DEG17_01885 [Cyanobacteria bacterium UBA11149]|nr:hypothetical protein [Cyanobacteria bacterium UBA11366]HBK66312.1 hypothetical protein [Cyanobacteria bacterium UBA11166]HBR77221.1 hypothetical protein [Cyanobacteria bacterium UBA11159]HBS72261.1 hypothetical protein [Cyanobacteria bacterium UBA11153]HBW87659.1 hypothetical protein [Cyanobacteria bacterium UBA11149]HCA96657.1 hypothetical protein [Cyanobacteria bacterium UBA9226]